MKRNIQLSISFTLVIVQGATAGHLFSFFDRELSEDIPSPIREVPTNLRKASTSSSSSKQIAPDGPFSLANCESYDATWLFDLHHSCFFGESGCQCEDAKQKIENNEIVCEKGITECPDHCPVCSKCMRQLGCLE